MLILISDIATGYMMNRTIEVIVYRRRTITILWSLVITVLLLYFLDMNICFASIVVAIGSVSVMLILGKYAD